MPADQGGAVAADTKTVIRLAGALSVEHNGRLATERDLPGRQPRLVLTVLAWNRGRMTPHEELAEIIWPSGLPETWQPALRALVSKVRSVLDLVGLKGAEVISSEPGLYRFEPPGEVLVDVDAAVRQLAEAQRALQEGEVETARRLAGEARSVLSRPLLAGVDSPWLDRRRDEIGIHLARCLECLGECRRRVREYDHAAHALEELLRLDPFREPAWRLLMRVHIDSGNVAGALRAYERCRSLLVEELGVDPSPETQELYLEILRGEPRREHEALLSPDSPSPEVSAISGCPYPGLRHFDEEDSAVFFGRDVEVDALVERLRANRFVSVVGPSGSGKSSLVRAGLLPVLRAGGLPDADTWRHATLVPGPQPLEALAGALLGCRSSDAVREATDRLSEDDAALHDAVSAVFTGRPATEQLVLVVDQFEELFTLCREQRVRRRFIAGLLHAARHRDSRVLVVLTLRADFYGRVVAHADLASMLERSQVLVPPLDGDDLELAIEGPARLAGLRLEDGLIGRILSDVASEPGALPLLQHALRELYERRADHVLTRGAYDDIGGVSGALVGRAEELWERLAPDERQVGRPVLLRLTEPGRGTGDTRRRAPIEELVTGPDTRESTEAVVRKLTEARLLVTSSDPGTGERSVEIAHETLLRAWPRLAAWIDEERSGLIMHRSLTSAAADWEAHQRHPDFLLSASRLNQVRGWVAQHAPGLNPSERAFLDAAIEAEAASQRRRARLRLVVTGSLAVTVVLLGLLSTVAMAQRGRANRESDVARSRAIAAEATTQLDIDPELGLLLAIGAYDTSPTAQAEAALRQALVRSTMRHRFSTPDADTAVAISPDAAVVATLGLSGGVLWDSASGQRLAVLRDANGRIPAGWTQAAAFSPDGTRLLATDLDGTAWIWSVPDAALVMSLSWSGTGAFSAVVSKEGAGWSPDGSRALVASTDGRVRAFDAASGRVEAELEAPGGGLARARYDPEGGHLVVAGASGEIDIVDTSTWEVTGQLPGHDGAVLALRFNDDGALLVSVGEDGIARVWEPGNLALLHVLRHDSMVRTATISGDGSRVLTADVAGRARVWDTKSGEALVELVAHDQRITQVRFDVSGRLALTASADGTARLWDATDGEEIASFVGSSEPVMDAEFSPGGQFVVTSGDDARLWATPRRAAAMIEAHGAPVIVRLSRDGRRMITIGWLEGTARVWDLDSRRLVASLPGQAGTTSLADLSPDGALAVTSPFDPTPGLGRSSMPPRVWDVETGEVIADLSLPSDDPRGVCGGRCPPTQPAFHPDGRTVAVGGDDGRIAIFEAQTGTRLLTSAPGPARHIEWSPDGRRLLGFDLLDADNALVVYDATSGGIVRRLPPVPRGVTFGLTAFAPDGSRVATTAGSTARVHDLATGRVTAELRLRGIAFGASFNPDGTLLVTASAAGAEIWDIATQRRLARLPGSQGAHAAAFTPDGKMIVVGGSDGTVRIHECEVCGQVEELLSLAKQRATRDLTPEERARFLRR